MKTLKDIERIENGRPALIICSGSTVKTYKSEIQKFINTKNPFTIGINNMVDYFIPNYHLWTNTQRFRTFGEKINSNSHLMLGSGIHLKTIKSTIGDKKYTLINYTGMLKKETQISYDSGKIYGYYRTAGCLAIMIANLMGASDIDIVGMDGYTKYKKQDLDNNTQSQHCYGKGFTDIADWKTCVIKDDDIKYTLDNLKMYGIKFQIITDTMYKEHYDCTRLYT